jgi:hypothetical protein
VCRIRTIRIVARNMAKSWIRSAHRSRSRNARRGPVPCCKRNSLGDRGVGALLRVGGDGNWRVCEVTGEKWRCAGIERFRLLFVLLGGVGEGRWSGGRGLSSVVVAGIGERGSTFGEMFGVHFVRGDLAGHLSSCGGEG